MNQSSEHNRKNPYMGEVAKGLFVLALLVLLMVWLAGGFIEKVRPGPPLSKPQAARYNTGKVERRVFPVIIEQIGSIRGRNEAQVSSRIMAQVKEILVKDGNFVSADTGEHSHATVLARLDDRETAARLKQAEQQVAAMEKALEASGAKLGAARAQLAAAGSNREKSVSDYIRYQDLHQHQAATGQQLQHMKAQKDVAEAQVVAAGKDLQAAEGDMERIRAQRDQARAALAEARVHLSHATIRAPFTGRVVKRFVNEGDMVSPGQPLFSMETTADPELHAFLSESLIQSVRVGQEIEVYVDALNRSFVGTLREIVPKSDPRTRTVLVKVSVGSDPDLVSGLFGRLRVHESTYEALVVPVKAVREVGQLHLVHVLTEDGHPRRHFVTLGKVHGDLIEVLSGLDENSEVVIH